MISVPKSHSPWDFGDALQLLKNPADLNIPTTPKSKVHRSKLDIETPTPALGDFSKLWKALEIDTGSRDEVETALSDLAIDSLFVETAVVKPPTVPDPNRPPGPVPKADSYASDGDYMPSRKTVTWSDGLDTLEEATDEPVTPTSDEGPGWVGVPKGAKKANKKEFKRIKKEVAKKKKAENKLALRAGRKLRRGVESDSEVRTVKNVVTPASKASKHIQQISSPSPRSRIIITRSKTKANGQTTIEQLPSDTEQGTKPTPKKAAVPAVAPVTPASVLPKPFTPLHNLHMGQLVPTSLPQPAIRSFPLVPDEAPQAQQYGSVPRQLPVATQSQQLPSQQVSHPYIPEGEATRWREERVAQFPLNGLTTPFPAPCVTVPVSFDPLCPAELIWNFRNHVGLHFQILPKEERDLQLLLRLVHVFGQDKKWLTKPVQLADHNSSPIGIHVFVDFSNIWIGFMEFLKNLQYTTQQRIPHQNLSFDALVLLLERKRPVAKRVLAGSYPLLPAMELAKAIGYETNILDKVYKSRELTEKQRRFQSMQYNRSSGVSSLGIQGSSSPAAAAFASPGTLANPFLSPVPTSSPEKWVEQGVDEILHLKILESIVDTDEPSRMVIATGDGSRAEYSDGFLKMITRALKKGWSVELVAFSKSIARDYMSAEFQAQWEGRFGIVLLDDYACFLLDT